MYMQVKSSNGISLIPVESRLMSTRKLFIQGEINQNMACEFVQNVMALISEDPEKPINVFVSSTGGEINAGMLIYDTIQSSPAPIRMFCLGRAYSMAAVLFASGNYGRYMLPHSELMIHEPLTGSHISGSSSSIRSLSESLLETKRMLNGILAKHTGRSEKAIDQATSYDHFYNPEESMEFGLCDGVVDFAGMMNEASLPKAVSRADEVKRILLGHPD